VFANYQPNEEYSINVVSQADSFGKAETIKSGAQPVLKLTSIISLEANVYRALCDTVNKHTIT